MRDVRAKYNYIEVAKIQLQYAYFETLTSITLAKQPNTEYI